MKLTVVGNVLTTLTCLIGAAFVLLYHLRAQWWPRWNRMGQNLMAYGAVLVAVTFLSVIRWIGGASLDTPWFAVVRLTVFAMVPITIMWRIVIMWRSTEWRWKPLPPPPPDPRDQLLYEAWCLLANAGEGSWENLPKPWVANAEAWRDRYHATFKEK